MSAVAAASGLILLGLAVFGQPDMYLRQAREQWASLIDAAPSEPAPEPAFGKGATQVTTSITAPVTAPIPDQLASPGSDQTAAGQAAAMAASMAQLQHQVSQLRDELASNRAEAERVRLALAAAQAQRQADEAEAQRQLAEAKSLRQEAEAKAQRQATAQVAVPAEPREAAAVPVPERHEAMLAPPAARHDPPTADRREPAKPVVPAPRPPPSRQEAEDAQSVLARLRQMSPGAEPTADVPQPAARPNRGSSTWLRRLIAARTALAAGQIEETRRLLQQAQLQLVFRPTGSVQDDPEGAARAASDVARALEALSANDTVQSRIYIDRAVEGTSSRSLEMPDREAASRGSGYAPAYPVR
jgi:hypothetical protein